MINQLLWLIRGINSQSESDGEINCTECEPEMQSYPIPTSSHSLKRKGTSSSFGGGITFTLHRANGGYVVSTASYDIASDRHSENLHVVPEDEELGEAISRIVTLEGLRNIGR